MSDSEAVEVDAVLSRFPPLSSMLPELTSAIPSTSGEQLARLQAQLAQLQEAVDRRAVELQPSAPERTGRYYGDAEQSIELDPEIGAPPLIALSQLSEVDQRRFQPQYVEDAPLTERTPAGLATVNRCNQKHIKESRANPNVLVVPQIDSQRDLRPSMLDEAALRAAIDPGGGNDGNGGGAVAPYAIRDPSDPAVAAPGRLSFGVYAERDLETHELLRIPLVYAGVMKTTGEFDREVFEDMPNEMDHLYTHDLHCCRDITIDATHRRNCAALINDVRGRLRSCPTCGDGGPRVRAPTECPRCKSWVYAVDRNVRVIEVYVGGMPILLVDNVKPLKAGEQLLLDYGNAFWERWDEMKERKKAFAREREQGRAEGIEQCRRGVKRELS